MIVFRAKREDTYQVVKQLTLVTKGIPSQVNLLMYIAYIGIACVDFYKSRRFICFTLFHFFLIRLLLKESSATSRD